MKKENFEKKIKKIKIWKKKIKKNEKLEKKEKLDNLFHFCVKKSYVINVSPILWQLTIRNQKFSRNFWRKYLDRA